ncbi:hypothetical protein [Staphylococcus arlettae]|uniref:hypothetical protein n=1 Tax=Staphylococcus arlettae TaxID=29378 RepID=UPI001E653B4B|nr:hypothetical protein [Staphylococcus arlettae]MCD9056019.1 hypothetical protein [Staphylococcus arlettae]
MDTYNDSIGSMISYERFVAFLVEGREIEFIYKDREYFISHTSQEGRALWCGKTRLSEYFNMEDVNKLGDIKIDGNSIADLLKNNEIKIQTIF